MHLRLVKDTDSMPVKTIDSYRLVKHFAQNDMPEHLARHVDVFISSLDQDIPLEWPWSVRHSSYFPDESDLSIEAFDSLIKTHHRPVCDWLIQHGAVPGESIMID